MREILFRGKRISDGEWVYGDLVRSFPSYFLPGYKSYIKESVAKGGVYEIDFSTVGQYTGLTDKNGKNGKKIFEGDITWFYGGENYQGYWEYDKTMVIDSLLNHECVFLLTEVENAEVIGNIYDNPELLEVKE